MKRFSTLCILGMMFLSANTAYAQMDAMDKAKEQAAATASEKSDAMSMKHDKMMNKEKMTPEQCATMMKEQHADMKMDAKTMDGMKHCKMMMGDKMKSMNMDSSKMMPKTTDK